MSGNKYFLMRNFLFHRAGIFEAQIVVEQWRERYNSIRPHSSLGYRPTAPPAFNRFMPLLD
jgi:transposase InsO family protein